MSRGFPSMTALLGLLAFAGYQNRDKIKEMIGGPGAKDPNGSQTGEPGQNGILGSLAGALGGGGAGGLNLGLRELLERFTENGRGEVAESWINKGPNKEIAPSELQSAIGADVLAEIAQRTGLSPEEVLKRLSSQLPAAVDKYTPEGRLPA